jgi:DNA-directed RNA polymerase subunit M/transcription elongation factor TFIIS
METIGPAEESLRLAEHYRQLTDDELIEIARQSNELTGMAQQALALEVASRKLTVPPQEPPVAMRSAPSLSSFNDPNPPDHNDPYAEDRQLVEIRKVWSEADARRLQQVLDVAGIPFYMGIEKATSVDDVTSNFAEGVPVAIMKIGVPWASQAMQKNYFPEDEPVEETEEDSDDLAVHCPKCHSTEVVFDQLVDEPSEGGNSSAAKFQWTCDSCGYKWEDDGAVTKE